MIVVSDTSPLNYLVMIEVIDVLPILFGKVYAPPTVIRELLHPRSPEIVRLWAASPPNWLTVKAPSLVDMSLNLDPGELEAIMLATEIHADFILIDERKGYKVAVSRGLQVVSTLAILEEAGARLLLDYEDAIERLDRGTSFYVRDELLEESRKRVRERLERGQSNGAERPSF